MKELNVAYEAHSSRSFDDAVEHCRQELAKEGFGVLSEIDIQAKLTEKLGVDVGPHMILGACHPPSAHQALEVAPEVSVLLPCNVTVSVEGDKTVIRAMRPSSVMAVLQRPELEAIGEEVGSRLQRVMRAVED